MKTTAEIELFLINASSVCLLSIPNLEDLYCYQTKEKLNCIFLSAYEVKNNLCLFERPFKIQKNGVFLFEISFFVLEILTFFYYAN